MDSPETNEPIITPIASSQSIPVNESPVFSYISKLSPIKPVKGAPVAQGFPGLGSPPLVFTSPRINPHRQPSFLKRAQNPQSSSAELEDDRGKSIATATNELGKPNSQLSSGLNPCPDKGCGSSSECVDEYVASLLAVDCADASLSQKHSENIPKSVNILMASEEYVAAHEIIYDSRKDADISEKHEEVHKKKASSIVNLVEVDGKQRGGNVPITLYQKVESDVSLGHAFDDQHYEHSMTEIAQAYEDCGDTTRAVSSEPMQSMMLHDPKASQCQSGMRRRCLQFGDAEPKSLENSPSSWNMSNSAICSRSPASPATSEVLESSYLDIPATPSNRQLANMTPPIFSMVSPQNNGNSCVTVSKPSGIGLHLNSIVSGTNASMISSERGYLSIRGKKLVSIRSSGIASSAISQTPHSVKPLNSKKPIDHRSTLRDEGTSNSEDADGVEEYNPRKKRKKTSGTSDGGGCKRCNCKKTKCLKLYCDCFAAGIYCDESCSCQGCFNRPEYEDTVLDIRQQIESKNPLAFAPKIVKPVADPPANSSGEVGHRSTPFSARHKRGCNCKKSMCLKKYCECYQANVGCSDGCRCEGCKNTYGTKEEFGMRKDSISEEAINERLEASLDGKLEMVATNDDTSQTKRYISNNLTPLTPSFQFSDHGKDSSKTRLPYGRYLPSPESDLTLLSSYEKSPESTHNHATFMESAKEILDIVPFDQERVDKFSPSHGLGDSPMGPSGGQLCYGSSHFSSASSLGWRRSPITPMTLFGDGTKLSHAIDSDDGLYDIMEDDTPEILKDDSTPPNGVKVSSPNKKRVSPPHSRLHKLGSSSSTGLRSGRKFILQAVPSFPPLTPCLDSKSTTELNTNGPQDCNSSQ